VIRSILLDILGPILALVVIGFWARRRFKIDIGTLSKMNIYLFVPAFLFEQVSRSNLPWRVMGGVVAVTVLQIGTLGLVVWGAGRLLRAKRQTIAAIAMAVMFYNSGTYGLPLAELAYPGEVGSSGTGREVASSGVGSSGVRTGVELSPATQPLHPSNTQPLLRKDGGAVQAFVVFCQNLLTYSVGLMIAAGAGGADWRGSAKAFFRMPTLYTLSAALLARWWLSGDGHSLPKLITETCSYLSKGMVPIALVTLGAQLAVEMRWPRWKPVSVVLVLRLLFGPIQMGLLLFGLHYVAGYTWSGFDLWPWPAESLILTAAVPTAVNTLLLTLEVGGDADLAADCVFWTTIVSCVTITAWLVLLKSVQLPG
jgi:predicted permease